MGDSKDTLHTPPPWKVDSYWDGSFKITRDLEPGVEPRYRREYDRRLIEAAPDMYELLEVFTDENLEWDSDVIGNFYRAAHIVMARVRGEL